MTQTLIVIPARYHSQRFPGKPLTQLAGKSMLHWVFDSAQQAAYTLNSNPTSHTQVVIATEDARIVEHAQSFGANALLTPDTCLNGTDRALVAAQQLQPKPDYVVNFQGDSPLTPASLLVNLITQLHANDHWQVATPIMPLTWQALDLLRVNKKTTPFSGTTATIQADGKALWFSKNIIPAIRNEEKLRHNLFSPVFAHVGLYAYRFDTLYRFVNLPEGQYEKLEGLEQLRLLENAIPIHTIPVDPNSPPMLGVDTPEDAQRVNDYLLAKGS
jgi:3-deoxy-manno-octulosonate cytidylyltransferase (CMP-KDO synthetase)